MYYVSSTSLSFVRQLTFSSLHMISFYQVFFPGLIGIPSYVIYFVFVLVHFVRHLCINFTPKQGLLSSQQRQQTSQRGQQFYRTRTTFAKTGTRIFWLLKFFRKNHLSTLLLIHFGSVLVNQCNR